MTTPKIELTEQQAQSKKSALIRFHELADAKYDEGQREHGGNLWEKHDLIGEIEKEVIDLWFYLQAIREKIEKV